MSFIHDYLRYLQAGSIATPSGIVEARATILVGREEIRLVFINQFDAFEIRCAC